MLRQNVMLDEFSGSFVINNIEAYCTKLQSDLLQFVTSSLSRTIRIRGSAWCELFPITQHKGLKREAAPRMTIERRVCQCCPIVLNVNIVNALACIIKCSPFIQKRLFYSGNLQYGVGA